MVFWRRVQSSKNIHNNQYFGTINESFLPIMSKPNTVNPSDEFHEEVMENQAGLEENNNVPEEENPNEYAADSNNVSLQTEPYSGEKKIKLAVKAAAQRRETRKLF